MLKAICIALVGAVTAWGVVSFFIERTFGGCGEGQIPKAVAGKGVYCVTAVKWSRIPLIKANPEAK